MREKVILQCTECKDRNYTATRDKRKQPERIEVKKFCKRLRRHTLHREVK